MPKKLTRKDWPLLLAVLLFIGFWSLAWFGLLPHPQYRAQKTEDSASNQAQESIQDVSAETVAYYTKVLAWFTGVLAIATLVQGVFLYRADQNAARQTRLSRANSIRQSHDTREAIRVGIENAERQAADTQQSIRLARDQLTLATEAFVSSHRARCVVRQMNLVQFEPDKPVTVRLQLFNIGDTDGTLVQYNVSIALLNSAGEIFGLPDYDVIRTFNENIALRCGMPVIFNIDVSGPIDALDYVAITNLNERVLHIMGYVLYKDKNGVFRRTGFLRSYDVQRRRFDPVPDPEYEYAD